METIKKINAAILSVLLVCPQAMAEPVQTNGANQPVPVIAYDPNAPQTAAAPAPQAAQSTQLDSPLSAPIAPATESTIRNVNGATEGSGVLRYDSVVPNGYEFEITMPNGQKLDGKDIVAVGHKAYFGSIKETYLQVNILQAKDGDGPQVWRGEIANGQIARLGQYTNRLTPNQNNAAYVSINGVFVPANITVTGADYSSGTHYYDLSFQVQGLRNDGSDLIQFYAPVFDDQKQKWVVVHSKMYIGAGKDKWVSFDRDGTRDNIVVQTRNGKYSIPTGIVSADGPASLHRLTTDGSRFVLVTTRKTVIINLFTRKVETTITHDRVEKLDRHTINLIRTNQGGTQLDLSGGGVTLINLPQILSVQNEDSGTGVHFLRFINTPQGRKQVYAHEQRSNTSVLVFDPKTGKVNSYFTRDADDTPIVGVSPDGRYLIAADSIASRLYTIDLNTASTVYTTPIDTSHVDLKSIRWTDNRHGTVILEDGRSAQLDLTARPPSFVINPNVVYATAALEPVYTPISQPNYQPPANSQVGSGTTAGDGLTLHREIRPNMPDSLVIGAANENGTRYYRFDYGNAIAPPVLFPNPNAGLSLIVTSNNTGSSNLIVYDNRTNRFYSGAIAGRFVDPRNVQTVNFRDNGFQIILISGVILNLSLQGIAQS